ncbi:MAG: class I SAM-dependent methyltransferase [Chromatiaceae bacterium]|nr:class I SAM-dependent methyltransferase [Chromatiaceae bacterium]MCF7994288.1 class I SAM-dependent methyltransferase [Chromatiaceae bacterium]MCF8003279.1 class I SAM-dependent methyltransferase [Chromatiaceae bacterium]MCF8015541.1 class I SAM-dependent methyltransferase [Chromatiaceae bacterium]
MSSHQDPRLRAIKEQEWFYEFHLPDGSKTKSCVKPSVRKIHDTREKMLCNALQASVSTTTHRASAIDVACHEGYYSLILAEYFESVTGIDKNPDSIQKAQAISDLLAPDRIRFENISLEAFDSASPFDFVLCYGLLYHHENPVNLIRMLATITRQTLCLETQVMPMDLVGHVEDGDYTNLRQIRGCFALCEDYPNSSEGGMTGFALVPSKAAVTYLLKESGFSTVEFVEPEADDYEQFTRGHRVVVVAQK